MKGAIVGRGGTALELSQRPEREGVQLFSEASSSPQTLNAIRHWLVARMAALVGAAPREEQAEIDFDAPFARFGLDSRQALEILRELEALVGRK